MEKEDIIWTSKLVINENIIRYKNTVIQISNVSRCEVGREPKDSYPIWGIIGLLLCIIIIIAQLLKREVFFQGAFILALCGILICGSLLLVVWSDNQNLAYYLIFELNSGSKLFFACDDTQFLKEAHKAIIECFNYRDVAYVVNFNDCTIENNQIGEDNTVNINEK